MEIGKPLRRVEVIPVNEPIAPTREPEPAKPPAKTPRRTREPVPA